MIESNQLNWRPASDGYSLHLERRAPPLLHVIRDKTYQGMWRIRFADGSLSDMTNLTRAKDAARCIAQTTLNNKLRYRQTGVEGTYSDPNAGEAHDSIQTRDVRRRVRRREDRRVLDRPFDGQPRRTA
jgi:hypothetical protein